MLVILAPTFPISALAYLLPLSSRNRKDRSEGLQEKESAHSGTLLVRRLYHFVLVSSYCRKRSSLQVRGSFLSPVVYIFEGIYRGRSVIKLEESRNIISVMTLFFVTSLGFSFLYSKIFLFVLTLARSLRCWSRVALRRTKLGKVKHQNRQGRRMPGRFRPRRTARHSSNDQGRR